MPEILPLLTRGMKIYDQIAQLGLPTPEVQYVSQSGIKEQGESVLARMVAYIDVFSDIAEDMDDDRFGKQCFDDTREYLENVCKAQWARSIFDHLARQIGQEDSAKRDKDP